MGGKCSPGGVAMCVGVLIAGLMGCDARIGRERTEIVHQLDLSRAVFYEPDMGPIVWIQPIDVGGARPSIAVFDQHEMRVLDAAGRTVLYKLRFPDAVFRPRIIEREGTRERYITSDGYSTGAMLMNWDGRVLWPKMAHDTGSRLATGDLDGDGQTEFYVGDSHGLQRVGREEGRLFWRIGGYFLTDMAGLTATKDRKGLLAVQASRGGAVRLFDSEGEEEGQLPFDGYVTNVNACDWPVAGNVLLATSNGDLCVIDRDGRRSLTYWAGQDGFCDGLCAISRLNSAPIRFGPEESKYLALVAFKSWVSGLAMLYVFSPTGELVYRERLHSTTGIAALDAPAGGLPMLLVGDGGNVYSYSVSQGK